MNGSIPRLIVRMILCGLLAALLGACGQSGITQTNKTERYTVVLVLDNAAMGMRTFTLNISDQAGAPVSAESVVIAPVMREMGMASPEVTAPMVEPGAYQVQADPFSMLGEWQLDVRIAAGGSEDTTTFTVEVK